MKILVLAAAPGIVALLLWALLDLENFVLLAVLGAIVFPASLVKPFGTNVDGADILMLLGLVAWLVTNSLRRSPDPWIKGNPIVAPALAYFGVTAVSIAWSIKPRSTIVFSVQLIELILVYPIVLSTLPSSVAGIRRALMLVVVLTTGQSIAAIAVFLAHPSAQTGGTYLPGINKNALGSFTAAGVAIGYALWLKAKPGSQRKLLLLATVVCVLGTVATGSRGAMVGAAIAVPVISLLLARHRIVSLALVGIGAAGFAFVVAPQQAKKTDVSGGYNSSLIRTLSYRDAVSYIERHPWLGTGARTYIDNLGNYGAIPDPNNLFLLTWAELGIPGLAVLGFLLFTFARLLVRAKRLPDDAAAAAVGAGGVALTLLVHFQFDISWVRGETTLEFAMIGLMLALIRLAGDEAPIEREPAVVSDGIKPELLVGRELVSGSVR